MKKIIIFSTILLVLFSFRTNKIVITGDLGISSDTGKNLGFDVSLFITAEDFSSKKLATAKCIDGKFTFEVDPVDSPKMAYISYNGSGHNIILENHDVKLIYRRDSGYKIEGGVYNNLIFKWESSEESVKINRDLYDLNMRSDIKTLSPEQANSYKSCNTSNRDRLVQLRREHMRSLYSHNDPYIRLFAVMESHSNTDRELEILSEVKEKIPVSFDLLKLQKNRADQQRRNEIKRGLVIGSEYKDFKAFTISGDAVKLSASIVKNEYLLLEFWASWCHPCREEMKKLPAVYREFKDKGFEIFSFSIDSSEEAWKSASSVMDIPWINAYSDKAGISNVSEIYAIESIPKNFLLDRSGKIVALNIKSDQLAIFLKERLK
jgi:thiol-disulfide isomerase/thioredoxin